MTIIAVIYILVGIIALCGVIGAYRFFTVINICGEQLANDKDQKHIDFVNNYEYCPKKEDNDA